MKMRMICVALAAAIALVCGCAAPAGADQNQVVVASDLDNAPFAYVDQQGHPAGRDVEMMEKVAELAGFSLHWKRMPFEQLLPAVQAGQVDAVCATIGITAERSKVMAFSQPYYSTAIAVVVRNGPGEPSTFADLLGKAVLVPHGTTSEQAVQRSFVAVHIKYEEQGHSSLERLLAGEVDARVIDGPAADAMVASSNGQLKRLPQNLDQEDYAIALPLSRVDLLQRINAALVELERSGYLAELNRRHGIAPSARSQH